MFYFEFVGEGGGGELSFFLFIEYSLEIVGNECLFKVFVQDKFFVFFVESIQDVSFQIILDGFEVREVQLLSCYNNEFEVVFVVSCVFQKEEELGNKSIVFIYVNCKEEYVVKFGLEVMLLEFEKILFIQV